MISDFLNVGDKVEMNRIDPVEEGFSLRTKYDSRILDFIDERTLCLAVPQEGGRILPLEEGGLFKLMIVNSGGLYSCRSEILRRYKSGSVYMLDVNLLTDIIKDQRRQYFRIDIILPLLYHVISLEEEEILERIENESFDNDNELRELRSRCEELARDGIHNAVLTNISGGGMKFLSDKPVDPSRKVRVGFALGPTPTESFRLMARMVMADQIPGRNQKYTNRIEFIHINREEREKIIRFVFKEERKQRQKEKSVL